MAKTIKITDAHPDNTPKQELDVVLAGGSPYYGYVWIAGEIYTIYLDGETDKVSIEPTN